MRPLKDFTNHGLGELGLGQAETVTEPGAVLVLVTVPGIEVVLGGPVTAQAEAAQSVLPLHHLDEPHLLMPEPSTKVQVGGNPEACKKYR